jgi:hypothetical protein
MRPGAPFPHSPRERAGVRVPRPRALTRKGGCGRAGARVLGPGAGLFHVEHALTTKPSQRLQRRPGEPRARPTGLTFHVEHAPARTPRIQPSGVSMGTPSPAPAWMRLDVPRGTRPAQKALTAHRATSWGSRAVRSVERTFHVEHPCPESLSSSRPGSVPDHLRPPLPGDDSTFHVEHATTRKPLIQPSSPLRSAPTIACPVGVLNTPALPCRAFQVDHGLARKPSHRAGGGRGPSQPGLQA